MALKPPHAKRSVQRIAFQVVDPFSASQLSALNFFSISLVVVLVGFLQVGTPGISICLRCFIWRRLPNMWRGFVEGSPGPGGLMRFSSSRLQPDVPPKDVSHT